MIDRHRQNFVRIFVNELVQDWGALLSGKKFYPNNTLKENLAKSIISSFPCLAIKSLGVRSYVSIRTHII